MASPMRIAATLIALPIWVGMMAAPAFGETTGFRLVDGPADSAGCHSLEVWKGESLLKTIPADDGSPTVHCARRIHAAILPNGNLVVEWGKHDGSSSTPYLPTELSGRGGTVACTERLRVFYCDC